MKSIVFLIAVALSQAALAQGEAEHPEAGMQQMYHGKLTEIERGTKSFTIETPTGAETFTLIEGGTVLGAGVETGFDALVVGQQVAVEAIQGETNRQQARSVQIVDSDEIAGQIEGSPAFDVADTVTVLSVDDDADLLEVQTRQGPATYRVTPDTRIQRDGKAIELDELEHGARVVVSADETSAGSFTARSVTVVVGSSTPADVPVAR